MGTGQESLGEAALPPSESQVQFVSPLSVSRISKKKNL